MIKPPSIFMSLAPVARRQKLSARVWGLFIHVKIFLNKKRSKFFFQKFARRASKTQCNSEQMDVTTQQGGGGVRGHEGRG